MIRSKLGRNEEKLLLLLMTGLALSFARSAKAQYRLLKGVSLEWKKISRYGIPRTVKLLERKKMVKLVRSGEDVYIVQPTIKGRERASLMSLSSLELPHEKKWDGKWRLVIFDIPEKQRETRNLLRQCLKNWQFKQLQASVFVSPRNCRNAVELLIRTCQGERYIRFIEATHIGQDWDLRKTYLLRQ